MTFQVNSQTPIYSNPTSSQELENVSKSGNSSPSSLSVENGDGTSSSYVSNQEAPILSPAEKTKLEEALSTASTSDIGTVEELLNLLVKLAAEDRKGNRESRLEKRNQAISEIKAQVEEIESEGLKRLIGGITGAVISLGGAAKGFKTGGQLKNGVIDSNTANVNIQNNTALTSVASGTSNSITEFSANEDKAAQVEHQGNNERFRQEGEVQSEFAQAAADQIRQLLSLIQGIVQDQNDTRKSINNKI